MTPTDSPSSAPPTPTSTHAPGREILLPAVAALIIVIVFQWFGPLKISLGVAAVTLYPMVWGLIAGGIVSAQKLMPFNLQTWKVADALMAVSVAMLVSLLAFTIGPNISTLIKAGPALMLQEIGHLFGTIALALPLAVMLRMGRATVGATFAIDREASFAIVGDRFGTRSDEYRGVLSMYVFGTLFGAVIVAFIASILASLDIFDPLALAMGAGVGSGSMMAAGAAAISGAHPEMAQQVQAMAATSNLITLILGTYVGVWIALPLADKVYNLLTRSTASPAPVAVAASVAAPASGASAHPTLTKDAGDSDAAAESAPVAAEPAPGTLPMWLALAVVTTLGFGAASIAAKGPSLQMVYGFACIVGLTVAAIGLAKLTRGKIQMIIWASVLGTYLSSPLSPVDEFVLEAASSINFLSMCTVVLTFGGLAMAQNLPALRKIGWRIVPVGIVAICASFVLATVIAEFALGVWK